MIACYRIRICMHVYTYTIIYVLIFWNCCAIGRAGRAGTKHWLRLPPTVHRYIRIHRFRSHSIDMSICARTRAAGTTSISIFAHARRFHSIKRYAWLLPGVASSCHTRTESIIIGLVHVGYHASTAAQNSLAAAPDVSCQGLLPTPSGK